MFYLKFSRINICQQQHLHRIQVIPIQYIFRYIAIFYPQTVRMTPRTARITITVIWIIAMCLFIPWAVVFQEKVLKLNGGKYNYTVCIQEWGEKYSFLQAILQFSVFLTCYLIPLTFIATCYLLIGLRVWKRRVAGMRGSRAERNIHRSKIRIVRMLLVVFVIFALSWLPLYSIELRILFGPKAGSIEKVIRRRYLLPLAQWLGAANSCVNPFIYCYFSANFRKSIVSALKSKSCCSKISV